MTTTSHAARRLCLAGLCAGALALTAACADAADQSTDGGSSGPTVTSSPPTPSAPSPSATPGNADPDADASAPAFPADTAVDTAEPSADARLTVTDVRVGAHDGFDRAVMELGGVGTPGWRVGYAAAGVEDPSDRPVDLPGDRVLNVMIEGTAYPFDTGLPEFSTTDRVVGAGTTAMTEVAFLGTFEAQSQAVIGVAGHAASFRVFLLPDPVRVVIDIQTAD